MIVAYLIFFLYAILISVFIIGNLRLQSLKKQDIPRTKVSVIVAFKDEASNLERLVKSLLNQDYPSQLLDFVFVNDHSEDKGKELLEKALTKSSFRYKILDLQNSEGKKNALDFGINNSNGDFILSTDADCLTNSEWVSTMVKQLEFKKSRFIAGPVSLSSENSTLGQLIQLEFAALIASTSGGFGINKPFMCNGANLGFTKALYYEIKPYENNSQIASGDDVFFLHACKAKSCKMSFVANNKALVFSSAPRNLKSFIQQRIRWAGKSKAYKDLFTIFIGLVVFATNITLLVSLVYVLINLSNSIWFLALFGTKITLDFFLLLSAKNWIGVQKIFLNSLLLSFLYPFYSVGIALLSLIYKPTWKGRKV